MEQPFVSIVIPAFNSASTIVQTIEACMGQDYPKDRLEIIVVDDGSTDNTRLVVEHYPVIYIYQKKKGPGAARNKGWRASKGELIYFTDADCIPAKDCLVTMGRSLYIKDVDAVAGSYGIKNERDIVARCIHAEIMFRHLHMPDYINSFGTYNLLIKRSVLEKLSGFNEDYLTSSAEDSEFSYRVIKKCYRIYFEKRAVALHFHEKSLRRYLRKQFERSFWAIILWRHHPDFALKDYYLHLKDMAELPMAVMVILTMPFLFIGSLRVFFFITLFIYIGIQAIMPVKICLKGPDKKVFILMLFMMSIRGFIRVLGGGLSLIKSIKV